MAVMFQTIFLTLSLQVYVVVGIAGVALTGCVLMVIILKYGRNSKFGIKGELFFLKEKFDILGNRLIIVLDES